MHTKVLSNLMVVCVIFTGSANPNKLESKTALDSLGSENFARAKAFKNWIVDSAEIVQQQLINKNPIYDSVKVFTTPDSENLNVQIYTSEFVNRNRHKDSVTGLAIEALSWNYIRLPKKFNIMVCYTELYNISMLESFLYEEAYEFCGVAIKVKSRKETIVYTLIKGNLTNIDTLSSIEKL